MGYNTDIVRHFKGMPKISYGECIRKGCRDISDLADGLCMSCWDRTSYKGGVDEESKEGDLDEESKDCIEEVEEPETLPRPKGTGNKIHMGNSLY